MIRVAAVGDIHIGADSLGAIGRPWDDLSAIADVLLLAGDLTKCGTSDEAHLVVAQFEQLTIPVVAVLGNHDHHAEQPDVVTDILRRGGVAVLEGTSQILDLAGGRLGIAGVKGFGGGFAGATATAFGEAEMKAFVRHTEAISADLARALGQLDGHACDVTIALTHYSPTPDTLEGERLEIHPFLGSQLLAEAIDHVHVDLAVHGHAHAGVERGVTAGGTPVRNVAMPVISCAYRVFEFACDDIAGRGAAAH